jgi:hypothetical protein
MPLRFDSDGWLVSGSDPNIRVNTDIRTRKGYSQFATPDGRPDGIVWHWTGGSANTSETNKDGLASYLRDYMLGEVANPDRSASWNFYLDKFGTLYQHASIFKPTWTTGAPRCEYWNPRTGKIERSTDQINKMLLGIEMENAGSLKKVGDKFYRWPFKEDGSYSEKYRVNADRAVLGPNGTYYDAWTPAQISAAAALSAALVSALRWQDPRQLHYSHEQFSPCGGGAKGKIDPGSLWMDGVLPEIEAQIFGSKAGKTSTAFTALSSDEGRTNAALAALVFIGGIALLSYLRKQKRLA